MVLRGTRSDAFEKSTNTMYSSLFLWPAESISSLSQKVFNAASVLLGASLLAVWLDLKVLAAVQDAVIDLCHWVHQGNSTVIIT